MAFKGGNRRLLITGLIYPLSSGLFSGTREKYWARNEHPSMETRVFGTSSGGKTQLSAQIAQLPASRTGDRIDGNRNLRHVFGTRPAAIPRPTLLCPDTN
jgi:hypothetical protein